MNRGILAVTAGLLSVQAYSVEALESGLQVLYDFGTGAGDVVPDVSGVGAPLDLTISDEGAVTWLPGGGLVLNSSVVVGSSGPATKIITACQASQAVTLEAWVAPASAAQSGPARIVAQSQDGAANGGNLVLGQNGAGVEARLRTTTTSQYGTPALSAGGVLGTALVHLVYTRDSTGATALYVDGAVANSGNVGGDFSTWGSGYSLALGNEPPGDRPWLGTLYLVAIYDRALNAIEVNEHYLAGPDLDPTPVAPTIVVQPQNQTVTEGLTATFGVTASGTLPLSYQWQRDQMDIPGATGSSYTTPPVTMAGDDGAGFRCMVTNSEGSATSDSATLTVLEATTPLSFEHIIVDENGPINMHSKGVGDLNGNGVVDLVVASTAGQILWYEYPEWTPHVVTDSGGGWSTDLEVGDINNDGDNDIVVSDWYQNSRIGWFENPRSDEPWTFHGIGSPRAHDIDLGDLDGDGDLDIVTRQQGAEGNAIEIWRQDPGNTWTHRTLSSVVGEGLHLGDLDSDGDPDVILGGRWYENDGDAIGGQWTERVFADNWAHSETKPWMADINGDERPDVVLTPSEFSGSLLRTSWYEAPLDPRASGWTEHIIDEPIETVTHSLGVGDMDNDGDVDVVTAKMHQGSDPDEIRIYLNESTNGTSWTKVVVDVIGSHGLRVADIDNDGDLDLFGVNWSGTQNVDLWVNELDPVVSVDEQPIWNLPLRVYPNPAIGAGMHHFLLSVGRRGVFEAKIFDLRGRLVRALPRETFAAGSNEFTWDGSDEQGNAVPSGVYLIQILAEDSSARITRKFTILR